MSEGFLMDASTAEVFFKVCLELNLNTEPERIQVLRMLVADKKAGYIRDAEAYMKDKKVLRIKSGG